MRESPQETLSRLGPYPRYPDFCTIQVDQRKGGFDPVPRRRERTRKLLSAPSVGAPTDTLLGADKVPGNSNLLLKRLPLDTICIFSLRCPLPSVGAPDLKTPPTDYVVLAIGTDDHLQSDINCLPYDDETPGLVEIRL